MPPGHVVVRDGRDGLADHAAQCLADGWRRAYRAAPVDAGRSRGVVLAAASSLVGAVAVSGVPITPTTRQTDHAGSYKADESMRCSVEPTVPFIRPESAGLGRLKSPDSHCAEDNRYGLRVPAYVC